ncbi:MAG: HEPN domain-containing protein [Sedimentisphaerales bacterium]|nr:HEPN domain-containing protein [Sedimentisphaerales bacterium]
MSQKIIDNWISLAEYDLATAQDMSKAGRYLYVAFMCQQAIEKILKACYVKQHESTPPYTHNLLRLIKEIKFKDDVGDEIMSTIEELNSYYIESRYTEDIEELSKLLTDAKAISVLNSTKELFKWIRARL